MQNIFYSISGLIKDYFQESMQKYNLEISKDNSLIVELMNSYCRLKLESVDNNYVRFYFFDLEDNESKYFIEYYLDALFGETLKYKITKPSEDWENQKKLESYIKQYNTILLNYFEKPMNGDFTWKSIYLNRVDELERLTSFLFNGETPVFAEIRKKYYKNSQTWEDEAKALYKKETGNNFGSALECMLFI